ncbi:hypothetical protein [Fischerella sp. PCC 9605]|uniref:hypothetical protein n=1 Tax=Fischerella sp. PCC 9605 TaxID=1173024 RepID=UPI00047E1803|nr:hypothetical protein [Fischerella sp. PCC 9605]
MPRRKKQPQEQLQQVSGENHTQNSLPTTQAPTKLDDNLQSPENTADVDVQDTAEYHEELPSEVATNEELPQEDSAGSLLVQDEQTSIQQEQPLPEQEDTNQENVEYSPLVRKLAAIANQEITTVQAISQAKNEAIVGILRNSDNRLLVGNCKHKSPKLQSR